jgi:D-hexose-6-phosphate mutarotase
VKERKADKNVAQVTLELAPDPASRHRNTGEAVRLRRRWSTGEGAQSQTRTFPPRQDFLLQYTVTLRGAARSVLQCQLAVTNLAQDTRVFSSGLHPYFAVEDADDVLVRAYNPGEVAGEGSREALLQGWYLDAAAERNVPEVERKGPPNVILVRDEQGELAIRGDTERVYMDAPERWCILDRRRKRKVVVSKSESFTEMVLWVPAPDALKDILREEERRFVCLEPANISVPRKHRIAPQQTWVGSMTVAHEAL